MGLTAALEPSRADGDIGAGGYGCKKAIRLVHGRGEIGVCEHDDLTEGLQHPGSDAVAFSAIAGILNEPYFRGLKSKVAHELCRRVFRAIVDHDDFSGPLICPDSGDNRLEGSGDAGAFVVCRYNDAVFR